MWLETRTWGSIDSPTEEDLREAIESLEEEDDDHPDTWVGDNTEWVLSADQEYKMKLRNMGGDEWFEMADVPVDKILALWLRFEQGGYEAVLDEDWQRIS